MSASEAQQLRGVAAALEAIAGELDARAGEARHLDEAILHLGRVRRRLYGSRRLPGSARARIRAHLTAHVGEWIDGEELAEVAGISEWARRVRELRDAGLSIEEDSGRYRLTRLPV